MAIAEPEKPLKISVIVLTYNRSDALLAVLRSLAQQCNRHHEVLIADDGSTPEHVQSLIAECPDLGCNVSHVWHPDIGFTAAKARNLAAYYAHGDYLIFIDGDCVVQQDFLQRHFQLAQQGAFVNGSRVLCSPDFTQCVINAPEIVNTRSIGFWLKKRWHKDVNKLAHLLKLGDGFFRRQKQFEWKGIRSCNFGVWREDFDRVNGFDESFTGWGHEDADLVLRLHNTGLIRKNGYCSTEVFHLWHKENTRTAERKNFERVKLRMQQNTVKAQTGLAELEINAPIKISLLHSV